VRFWREIARVAKPGAFLLAFGGTRTHHRLMVAIEDAGWEIRDCMMWLYAQGFPKSYDISKGMDKAAGTEREVVESYESSYPQMIERNNERTRKDGDGFDRYEGANGKTAPATPEAQQWDGWGTALKPAWEPIIVAMNPRDGTFVNNALKWGVSGIWVDGGRIPTGDKLQKLHGSFTFSGGDGADTKGKRIEYVDSGKGRWPANLIIQHHPECRSDCHPDCPVRMLAEQSGESVSHKNMISDQRKNNGRSIFLDGRHDARNFHTDTGTAARFFYTPKASKNERTCDGRVDNDHPTVKPVEIMRYLVRLTKTPTGGTVLDPFAGSGTTLVACLLEGRDGIGIDQSEHACHIARERVRYTLEDQKQPELL